MSNLYGSITVQFDGSINTFKWNPRIQTFALRPQDTAPASAGSPPSTTATLPIQEVIAGQAVRPPPPPPSRQETHREGQLPFRAVADPSVCCLFSTEQNFSLALPADLFQSNTPGLYGFVVSLRAVGGGQLPGWIRFNETTSTLTADYIQVEEVDFSACPFPLDSAVPNYCGRLSIELLAADAFGGVTSAILTFHVAQAPPSVQVPIGEVFAPMGSVWQYSIENVFQNNVREGRLNFATSTRYLDSGAVVQSLPPFLEIMSTNLVRRLEGTPSWADVGHYAITLMAVDAYGWTSNHTFTVSACFVKGLDRRPPARWAAPLRPPSLCFLRSQPLGQLLFTHSSKLSTDHHSLPAWLLPPPSPLYPAAPSYGPHSLQTFWL